MGGGPKHTEDVSKGAPRDPLGAPHDEASEGEAQAYSYCRREHQLTFALADEGVHVGAQARLVPSNPVQVMADGRLVGQLSASDSIDMAGCQEAGYTMHGAIRAIDMEARVAVLTVRGEPA